MTKYKCGHKTEGLLVADGSPTSISAYLVWAEGVGIYGDKSQCWECFNKSRKSTGRRQGR